MWAEQLWAFVRVRVEYQTTAPGSACYNSALFDAFIHGLSLEDQLASLEIPADTDYIIFLAIRIDKHLVERDWQRGSGAPVPSVD